MDTKYPIEVMLINNMDAEREKLSILLNEFEGINITNCIKNIEAGLSIIKNDYPDVIITDISINDSYTDIIKKIKSINNNVKIIVLTSDCSKKTVYKAFSAGVSAYCLKNIKINTLTGVIFNVYEGAIWFDPSIANFVMNLFTQSNEYALKMNTDYDKKLTEREKQVLKLLVTGKSNTEIAKELIVSVHTAKAHVCSILQKLGVSDRVQAAVKATKENIV